MNIFYLSQARLPSSAANSVHVNKMCDALAKQKHNVTLLGYKGNSDSDIYEYYSTTRNYTIKTFDIEEKAGESIWLALKTLALAFHPPTVNQSYLQQKCHLPLCSSHAEKAIYI